MWYKINWTPTITGDHFELETVMSPFKVLSKRVRPTNRLRLLEMYSIPQIQKQVNVFSYNGTHFIRVTGFVDAEYTLHLYKEFYKRWLESHQKSLPSNITITISTEATKKFKRAQL